MFLTLFPRCSRRPSGWLKKGLIGLSTAAFVVSAAADGAAAAIPAVVADSDAFEIVGRLYPEGLVLHVDRAPDNAPVLGATLQVETAGRNANAAFRSERGDYLVADADWLAPLRAAGEHPLAFTLVAGNDGDLLTGELIVDGEAAQAGDRAGRFVWPLAGGAALLGLGAFAVVRRRRGGAA